MASNFQFLAEEKQFEGLYHVAVVAESSYNFQPQDPDTTIMLTRKALEYAVKWIYTYDSALNTETKKINIEKDPLSKLITIKTFRDIVGNEIYKSIDFLRILGNRSAHSFNNKTTLNEAEVALENLFIVCDFIYYCYSKESKYINNKFDIDIIKNTLPIQKENIDEDTPLIKVSEKEQIDHTKTRLSKKDTFIPKPLHLSEKETRKVYIDTMLREAGWKEGENWINEYIIDKYKYSKTGKGKIDYVLLNKEGTPIAIIEAKREDRYEEAGIEQAREYCIALKEKFGIKPVIFLSNGYNFTIWQEGYYHPREIYGFYSEEDLLKTANILENRKDISNVETRPEIADRYYQIQAVKSICSAFQENRRKALLVMATGSGKTYSALLLAYGLCNDWSKIAIIDSENGSADLYAHLGTYNVLSLQDNFTPETYMEAIRICETAGMEVIIIDSISQCWDNLLEYHAGLQGNSFTNWQKVTPRINAFMQKILQSEKHIICTMRCKQDYVLNEKNGKLVPEKVGLKAVMRDGIDYEFTIVFDINMKHQAIASKDRTNLFIRKPDFVITPTTGQIILDWCNDGVNVEQIKQQINNAKNIEELTAVYHKYPEWYQQLTSDFMQKKIQLQEQQNKPSINYNPNFIRYGSNAVTACQG